MVFFNILFWMGGSSLDINASIPVADQSIDLIVAHWVLEHIENPSQLATEFFRI